MRRNIADFEMGFNALTHVFRLVYKLFFCTKKSRIYVRRDKEQFIYVSIIRTSVKCYRVFVTGYAQNNHRVRIDIYKSFRYLYELCWWLNNELAVFDFYKNNILGGE